LQIVEEPAAGWVDFNIRLTGTSIDTRVYDVDGVRALAGDTYEQARATGGRAGASRVIALTARGLEAAPAALIGMAWFGLSAPRPAIVRDGSFGVVSNRFGFNLDAASGHVVVVETSTNLQPGSWLPLWTNTLSAGPLYFSDPQPATNAARYYRVRLQ